ncbi:DsbA family protein [Candidatus Uhrbacteria bacterium]|nr:DsbA family protein [Candidatus Uhrbacteria bacterium]
MRAKHIWIFIGTFVIVAVVGIFIFAGSDTFTIPPLPRSWTAEKGADTQGSSSDFILAHAQSDIAAAVGPKDARVVVVEFLDFQCPFCKKAHPILFELLKEYENKSVRFEFRHFPLVSIHPFAVPSSLASLCANEQGKFLEFYDMAYSRQQEISLAGLATFAKDLRLNLASFNACMAEKRYEPFIKKDLDDALTLALEGTPTWFVNATRLVGVVSYESFKAVIDNELER